jgi:hypothetical protein
MAFDLESIGGGGISGIFIGIITALGLKSKVDKLDDKKLDKSVFDVVSKSIDEKFSVLVEGQGKLFDKVDKINEFLRNSK